MKQLAIHSLGWGAGLIAMIQLPALASNSRLAPAPSIQTNYSPAASSNPQPPQLIAVELGVRSLAPGDEGQDVRILQRFLRDEGLYPYFVDGIYGEETASAVATYQRIRGLPDTGVANESTLVDMDFDFLPQTQPAYTPSSSASRQPSSLLSGNLGPGSTGSDVIALQRQLNYFGIPVFVDGDYGFETEQAVRTYQRVQGLPVTGSADSRTLETMGFEAPRYPYVAAIIADESALSEVQRFFPNAYVDRNRRGRFINIGSFGERFPAEARSDAAKARGFTTRVLYSRPGLLLGQ